MPESDLKSGGGDILVWAAQELSARRMADALGTAEAERDRYREALLQLRANIGAAHAELCRVYPSTEVREAQADIQRGQTVISEALRDG